MIKRLFQLFVIVAVLGGAGAVYVWFNYLGVYQSSNAETFIEIERGTSTRAIAQELADHDVIRAPWLFMAIRALHPRVSLQAGEYRFGPAQSPVEVFEKIRRGDIFFEELTIPEGSNRFDIANLLKQSDTVKPEDFLTASRDPKAIHEIDPLAPTLEGYLFPSTYRLTRKTSARQLCNLMVAEFRRQWATAVGNKTSEDAHRVVTLASLVEKETGVPAERPLVAAVFTNRLRTDMALQCDPTVVYAALLQDRYRGTIYKSDLASGNPYNTYTHSGLPPGPIANPGLTSLRAALQPAETNFVYFVAKPNGHGSHQFSATLTEHLKAVDEFRKAN